jgi:serine/threonine protein kinase/dienelactone hydrolase
LPYFERGEGSMKCPKCQAEILDDSQFCSKCGTPIHPGDKAFLSHTRTILRPIDELVPGKILADKYKIIEVVGKGGMGIVYRAEDTKLKRKVALKFLPPELMQNKEAKERFVLEAQSAAALSHPNICTIHEIDEEDGRSFIAMEYVEGQSLRNKIDRGPIDIEEAMNIAIQVAEGMEQAHKKGIVHRDIKSANIMVTDSGQAKIMDFGLAKVKGGTLLTREGTTLGTVAYMSPEQARGEDVDLRSDIWSLGIVMYEMLTGQLPFMGEREASILYSVVHEEAKPVSAWNPAIPSEIQRIIDHSLKKKREDRYASASEILKDLQKFHDSLKVEKIGDTGFRSFLRLVKKPIVAFPAILVIAAIAIAAVWFFNRQAKIRYARQELLPEIERIINLSWHDTTEAYSLAEEAEKYIPSDPKLGELISRCSREIRIETVPPGAKIYMKDYKFPESEWKYVGRSPIDSLRMPLGFFRWKIEKEEYETVHAVSASFGIDTSQREMICPVNLKRNLDKKGSIPPNMVRVASTNVGEATLGDFVIDKYEVTNKDYKAFIDKGGYRNQEYWKQKFIKNGKELTWEEAMAEFVDQTGRPGPATWRAGDYPEGRQDYPVSGVSWYEAAAYADFSGKTLPTLYHWGAARGEFDTLTYYSSFYSTIYSMSNFQGNGPVSVGTFHGMNQFGCFDMAGNVREWCWNETPKGRIIRGGAWNDAAYMYINWSQANPFDRSPKNGFRCAQYLEPEKVSELVTKPISFPKRIDFYEMTPVSDEIFQVFKNQYEYDKKELNTNVEWRDESSDSWIQEKITLDAAYGGERIIAYLFLPKNVSPPYQTVLYFPGSGSADQESSKDMHEYMEFRSFLSFIITNGRAVIYPVYKGTFERSAAFGRTDSHQYAELRIQQVQDLMRCIDFLETRPDIDSQKLAFLGISWGGWTAPIIHAVEERFKASIAVVGGLRNRGLPEVNPINFVTRAKTPILMLNGKYDMAFPYETSAKPMYDLLGTPAEHKVLKLYEGDHFVPMNEYIKETLAWLDKYLGPVNR